MWFTALESASFFGVTGGRSHQKPSGLNHPSGYISRSFLRRLLFVAMYDGTSRCSRTRTPNPRRRFTKIFHPALHLSRAFEFTVSSRLHWLSSWQSRKLLVEPWYNRHDSVTYSSAHRRLGPKSDSHRKRFSSIVHSALCTRFASFPTLAWVAEQVFWEFGILIYSWYCGIRDIEWRWHLLKKLRC